MKNRHKNIKYINHLGVVKVLNYLEEGNKKLRLNDYEGAISDYSKAIKQDEKNVVAYNNRGILRACLGYDEEAMSDYNKVIELDENNAVAYNHRGILKRDIINFEKILKDLEELKKKNEPETSNLEEIKKIEEDFNASMNDAINDLEKAVKLDSEDKLYSNNLKKTKEIFDDFKFEIGLNPQTQTGFLVFADIMGWKGIWQKKDFDENTTLKTMLRIKHKILKIETKYELKVNLISDTFVIFSNQLEVISNACKILIESCLDSNLVIRGAIAYGTYYNLDTVYVGPTVDEAASWHEKAEEVAIMCTTSARMEVENSIESSNPKSNYGMIKHDVCTKQGKMETYVIDWYTKENEEKFINIMKETQVYPELYNKYSNTEKSLKKILEEQSKSDVSETREYNVKKKIFRRI